MSYPPTLSVIAAPATLVAPAADDWQPTWGRSVADDDVVDVTVCIANWNCRDHLRGCLESLHDQSQGVRVETVVVDNASSDGAAEMVERDFPSVVLVRNRENVGFARASNQAAERARGRYVFFLNNDTVVPANTLRQLLDFAEDHPDIGMFGPLLRDGDGQPQISYRRRPTIAALLHKTMLFRWTRLFRRAYREYRRDGFVPEGNRTVETLMGAAVLIRQDVFAESGGWDDGYLFGGEDIDLSTRIGHDYELAFVGDIEVTHFGRISSRQNVGFAAPNVTIGYARYFRKSGASTSALRWYKLAVTLDAPLQMMAKSLEYTWRTLTRQAEKAEKSRHAMAGVWRFLRHELRRFWRE